PGSGDLAVGPGAGRGGGAAAGPCELRLVAGLQSRRNDTGIRIGRLHGSSLGHRAAQDTLRGAPRGGIASARSRAPSGRAAPREKKDAAEVAEYIRADRSLSEPRRHASLRALLRAAMTAGQQEQR